MGAAIDYYTYEDYKKWDGDWELVDGRPVAMGPSPMIKHQKIANLIAFELTKSIKECKHCFVVFETDYIVDEYTVLRPDIALLCDEENDYITKPPKLIVEIVSPSSAKMDEKIKYLIYAEEKVPYFVLFYPDFKKARIFKLVGKSYEKMGDFTNKRFEVEIEGCKASIDFSEIF